MEFEYLKYERSKPPKRWMETAFWILLGILFLICKTLLALSFQISLHKAASVPEMTWVVLLALALVVWDTQGDLF